MSTPNPFTQRFEQALTAVSYPSTPEGLYPPVRYMLEGGGKRLRPTLLLMSYALYRPDYERALPAALAIETYHNHTLLHDDLMDRAAVRHGRPTVHCRWSDNAAILSGDTMLILAFRHLLQQECTRRDVLLSLFAQTMQEVCEGQQYDVNFESRSDVSEREYLEMIRLKTAVLPACAARAGALIADASEADCAALYSFAESIGLAFQLQDDYLDVYGDPALFGKAIGGDILCGKKTYLLIHALQRSTAAERADLLALLASTQVSDADKIARVTARYDALDVPALTLRAIDGYYARAQQALGSLSLPPERTEPLWQYACSLLGRKA